MSRVTSQSVQVNEPSISEAISDKDVRGRLTEESQASAFSCLGSQTPSVNQSQATLANTPSLRPRRKAKFTRPERFPAVSVVIPARRNDELVARTKKHPPTRVLPCSRSGDSDSGNLNNDRATRALTRGYSPSSGGSNSKARGRPWKRPKTAVGNTTASSNDDVGKCTSQSQKPLEGGLAVTPGKTQEIFGRGVLRIQAHGPRHAYFMTFLPEISHRPSTPSPTEMPPDQSSRPEDLSENASSRQVGRRGRHKRTMSTTCEDGDGWSTKPPRHLRSRDDRNKAQRKPRRSLPWSSEEVDFLRELRSDEQRPWSEVTRLFSDRYPGRSSGAIQVYWCTSGRQKRMTK